MNQLIHSFTKNSDEEVRISIMESRGSKYIDFRVYSKNENKEYIASEEGINLPFKLFSELKEAIIKIDCAKFMVQIENTFFEDFQNKIGEDIFDQKKSVFENYNYIYYKYRYIMVAAFSEYSVSKEWSYVREEVMKRDNYSCVDCHIKIEKNMVGVVHHEYYDNWGRGDWREINSCVYLCGKCHNKRHTKTEMQQKVPFWANRGGIWEIARDVNPERIKEAMKNLRDSGNNNKNDK